MGQMNMSDPTFSLLTRSHTCELRNLYEITDNEFVLPLSRQSKDASAIIESVFREGEYVGGFLDSKLICCGGYRLIDERHAEIHGIVVHPDQRKKGYAKRMIYEIFHRARGCGVGRVVVGSWEGSAGLSLFRSMGFKECEWYDDADKRPPGVRTVRLSFELDTI